MTHGDDDCGCDRGRGAGHAHGAEDGPGGDSAGGGDDSIGDDDPAGGEDAGGRAAGDPDAGDGSTAAVELRLSVPEMDCPSCAGKVERSVRRLEGVLAIDPRPTSGTLVVTYDSDATDPEAVRERVTAAGYAVSAGRTEHFAVPEMDCPSCAGKIERALEIEGVLDVDTRPTSGEVVVTFDPDRVGVDAVVAAIEGAGYPVERGATGSVAGDLWRTPRAKKTGVGAVLLAVGLLLEWGLPGLNPALGTLALGGAAWTVTGAWVAYLGAVLAAGVPILRNGYYSVRTRNLDIHLLMAAGIVGAVAIDHPFEAATLAVLFSTAELLERFSMERARDSLRELMELSPDTATVLREVSEPRSEGSETESRQRAETTVPAGEVAVGETAVVRPGERVPLDGVVSEGESALDESPITGESVPADKAPGDEVYAGSINEAGYLEVEVTAPASESTIATVVDLVEEAGAADTDLERFVDRFADVYTPVVVAAALATMALPPLLGYGGASTWFVRGLAMLVIACPCAFVISTPVSVVSGITAAARNGVLIKGGTHLEAAGSVDTVAVDKTGTLTTGELGVTDVVPLGEADETDLLRCARSIEARSEHPVAEAVVDYAAERGVDTRSVADFEAIAGKGVRAELDGRTHYAGKPGLFEELGFDLEHAHVATDGEPRRDGGPALAAEDRLAAEAADCEHGTYLDLLNETVPRLQAEGKTVLLVGTADRLEGVIAVADTVRPEARWAVDRLHALGIDRVVMLTGDNGRTARAIGEAVGVDEVRADLLPAEKVAAVDELDAERGGVLMVGDGINDAPALAASTVGVAMGAAGTDAALETADVALMRDDLSRLPYLLDLAGRAGRVIRGSIGASLAVKGLLAVGAPLGYVSIAAAVLVGDMGMSLGVTGNALRLARVEPAEPPAADG